MLIFCGEGVVGPHPPHLNSLAWWPLFLLTFLACCQYIWNLPCARNMRFRFPLPHVSGMPQGHRNCHVASRLFLHCTGSHRLSCEGGGCWTSWWLCYRHQRIWRFRQCWRLKLACSRTGINAGDMNSWTPVCSDMHHGCTIRGRFQQTAGPLCVSQGTAEWKLHRCAVHIDTAVDFLRVRNPSELLLKSSLP